MNKKKLPDKGREPRPNSSSRSNSIGSNSCKSFAGVFSIAAVFSLAIIGFGMQTSSSTTVTTAAQVQNDITKGIAVAETINLNDVDAQWVGLEMKNDAFATNSQSFAEGLGGGRTMKIPNSALTTTGGGEKGSLGQYSFGCERNNLGDLNGIAAG